MPARPGRLPDHVRRFQALSPSSHSASIGNLGAAVTGAPELPLGVHDDLDRIAPQTDDCDMQAEAEVPQARSVGGRSPGLWWHLVLIACAVVVALSSLVIARSEMRQADYLRRA